MKKRLISLILIHLFLISSFGLQGPDILNVQSHIVTDVNNLLTTATAWSNATVVSDDATGWNDEISINPSIAIDGDGNIHVVWDDSTDGEWGTDSEIMYSKNTGVGWSNATVVSDDVTGWNDDFSYASDIAIDGDGNVHVVWVDHTDSPSEWGTDIEIMYAKYTGASWSNATVISSVNGWNNGNSQDPKIAIDGYGFIHVVWEDDTSGEWGTDWEIMYAKNTGAGWSNATCISDIYGWNNGSSINPSIAIDGDANVHVVWYDTTDGEWGTDSEIMYTKRNGIIWSNATVVSDDATGWNDDTSEYPDIAIDDAGNVHIVWEDQTDGEWGTDLEIMYAKQTLTGWETTLISDIYGWNDGSSYYASIAIDGDGNVHVVWVDSTNGEWGTDSEIMYSKNTGAGWSNATVISDDTTGWNDGNSNDPEIAIDSNGNMHVVLEDSTDGEWGTDGEIMYTKKFGSSSSRTPSEESPIYLIGTQGGDISSFLLSPLGLGIIACFGTMLLILVVVVINNNKTIKELNKKISKNMTFKK